MYVAAIVTFFFFFFSTDVVLNLVINSSHTYNANGLVVTAMWQVRLVRLLLYSGGIFKWFKFI